VHLLKEAIAVLMRMPRRGKFVFSLLGTRPFQSFSAAKRKLDKLSEVADWRLHDLRRTCVSGMARLGIAPHVADKILNHQTGTISGVAAVYQRHEFLAERKDALELWGAHVAGLLKNTERLVAHNFTFELRRTLFGSCNTMSEDDFLIPRRSHLSKVKAAPEDHEPTSGRTDPKIVEERRKRKERLATRGHRR
jgi:hypothetical protein